MSLLIKAIKTKLQSEPYCVTFRDWELGNSKSLLTQAPMGIRDDGGWEPKPPSLIPNPQSLIRKLQLRPHPWYESLQSPFLKAQTREQAVLTTKR
ncbi:hypothetical protein [Allocoleopsis sp.]|uniref:hypothetical protein n=1 Tax=Allocoleopsis sp. TaxID=3088169 RepID=UPI002FD6A62E